MFDLLGLPMCNTGLSLFRMACRSASGPRFGDGGRPSALAAAATEKWKSKRKTKVNSNDSNSSNHNNNNNNNNDATVSMTSTMTSAPLQPSTRQPSSLQYGPGKQRGANVQLSSAAVTSNSPVWGNGQDWRRPVDVEGDWVRVYPFVPAAEFAVQLPRPRTGTRPSQQFAGPGFSSSAAANDSNTARAMIKNIQEYLRCCKKVARSCEGLTVAVADDELNDKLKDLFPGAITPWLPPN